MRTLLRMVAVVTLGVAGGGIAIEAEPQGPPQAPPPRPIPGITAPDAFPRGCVDCHVNRPDLGMDVRLGTFLRKWQEGVQPDFLARVRALTPAGILVEGKHPAVDGALADVPNSCLACHGRSSDSAPPFATLLHGLHFGAGEKSHFVSMFQGECTHCHKLDLRSGTWSLKRGGEE